MGRIDSIIDPTGQMSQTEVNQTNLENIISEMNRNSDQLDAVANSLNIINKGTITGTWSGTGGINSGFTAQVAHGFGSAPIFIAFFNRSDQPSVWQPVPQWFYDNSGNLLGRAYAYSDSINLNLTFALVLSGSPIQLIFSYYILQQPAQVPTGH